MDYPVPADVPGAGGDTHIPVAMEKQETVDVEGRTLAEKEAKQ